MIKTMTESEFTAAFHNMGRGKQFSHKGLCALYDYLTELEEDCEIGLCCEFTEYDSFDELQDDYSNLELTCLSEYKEYTQVIEIANGGIIIQSF